MSRNAEFRNSVMYHGNRNTFEIGDTITPADTPSAWATSSYPSARIYSGWTNVYTVEPVDAAEVRSHPGAGKDKTDFSSKLGFKVTGKVEHPE